MDFVKALTYPFDDPDWLKKLGIAVLVSVVMIIIPLIGTIPGAILMQGWSIEIIRRVKNNNPTPLAEWDDLGGLFNKGLAPFLASIVYQIPTLIFACIAVVASSVSAAGANNDNTGAGLAGASFIWVCCGCLIFLYAIAAGIVFWGGLMRYIDKPEFGTFMQFGENLALVRNNIGDFGMALVFILIGGAIAGVLSGTGIGALLASAFTTYFSSHILGQLAQKLSAPAAPQV